MGCILKKLSKINKIVRISPTYMKHIKSKQVCDHNKCGRSLRFGEAAFSHRISGLHTHGIGEVRLYCIPCALLLSWITDEDLKGIVLDQYKCAFCKAMRDRMTVLLHPTGKIMTLCFFGCQNFPEPYRATGLSDEWVRIDPWQDYKKELPRLRKKVKYT
jgi:hypothetical protein